MLTLWLSLSFLLLVLLLGPDLPLLLLRFGSEPAGLLSNPHRLTLTSLLLILSLFALPPLCVFPPLVSSVLSSPPQDTEGGCNGVSSTMLVSQDYSALKENEICVSQGETVQILATNQQNMYLVYRPANSQSPAAEGWVPGSILGPLTKPIKDSSSTSSFSAAVADANNIK